MPQNQPDDADSILDDVWFDNTGTHRCLAIGLRLPILVPLIMGVRVDIDTERLARSQYRNTPVDSTWLTLPTSIRMYWGASTVGNETPPVAQQAAAEGVALRTGTPPPSALLRITPQRQVSLISAFVPINATHPTTQELRTPGTLGPLDLALWAIEDLIRATRLDGHPIPDVTVESLPTQDVALTYADVRNEELNWTGHWWAYRHTGPLADNTGYRQSPLTGPEQRSALERFADLRLEVPSATMNDLLMRAHISLDAGQPETAIVGYAIACEYAIMNIALAIKWEAGEEAEAAANTLDLINSSPRTMLRKCNALGGGSWEDDSDGVIAAWLRDVADRRNRIVHRGERSTTKDADHARKAAGRLIELLKKRIVRSPAHPKTTSLFAAHDSVRAYASKSRKQSLLDALTDESTYKARDQSFREWRDHVYSFRDSDSA